MKRPFYLSIRPEALSTTGTDVFELHEIVTQMRNGIRYTKLGVNVYGNGLRLVSIYSKSPETKQRIQEAKKALKSGLIVPVRFKRLSLQSFRFNNSSGITLYADDFYLIEASDDIPLVLNEMILN